MFVIIKIQNSQSMFYFLKMDSALHFYFFKHVFYKQMFFTSYKQMFFTSYKMEYFCSKKSAHYRDITFRNITSYGLMLIIKMIWD